MQSKLRYDVIQDVRKWKFRANILGKVGFVISRREREPNCLTAADNTTNIKIIISDVGKYYTSISHLGDSQLTPFHEH